MKYMIQLLILFAATLLGAEAYKVSADHTELKKLCVKNATPEKVQALSIDVICECSVKKSLEFIQSSNFKDKNFQPRLEWLKKMYSLQLSQKEVDEDPYDIFEFNSKITEGCMNELSQKPLKKENQKK